MPDIAYVSNERLAGLEGNDLDSPPFSPDVAIEILSPDDVVRHVEHKIALYVATGASLVIIVDPPSRSVRLHDAHGMQTFCDDDVMEHPEMPGFRLALSTFFSAINRPQ